MKEVDDLSKRERILNEGARKAGEIQMEWRDKQLEHEYKGKRDFVTDADLAVEDAIRNHIRDVFPDDRIVGEERDAAGESTHEWVIDPIDGTTNYYHGMDTFSVSLAYLHEGTPCIAAVYAPARDEFYRAVQGEGAFLNDTSIEVSSVSDWERALVGVDNHPRSDEVERMNRLYHKASLEAHGVRSVYSAALTLCFVAKGALDATCWQGLSPWDLAAGGLILTEAGGRITDFDGSRRWEDVFGGNFVGSNGSIHGSVLDEYESI